MDQISTNSIPQEESSRNSIIDPSWEKWRNDQVQTISNILSHVFKVEDEVRQSKAPSRLLRTKHSTGDEQEICEKLNAIRQQISEYEQMLQLSLQRIDKALQVVQPAAPLAEPAKAKPPSRIAGLKKWARRLFKDS
jgi:hypothetical protein